MSKAVEGAALLAGAVGMGALAFFDPAVLAIPGYAQAMFGIGMAGVSMEAGAIASALTNNRGMSITTRQAAAARQVIYGQQRVGGVTIYQSTTGSHHDQYNYVIVLAGHECDSIVNLYLDGRQVHWEVGSVGNTTRNGVNFGGSSNGNAYTGPNGVLYNFSGAVYCEARFGDQLPGDVIGGLTANDPNWAADGSGNSPWVAGCTYVYLKIEYNTNVFPSEPEIRFTVNGKNNIYDPRTNSSVFTCNWALVAADVITDPVFGLGDNTVNQAQLIAAANVCDEQVAVEAAGVGTEARYTTNHHYDTSVSPGDALNAMLPGAAGRLSRIGGEWFLWPAYWQGPSFTFDESALTASMQWTPYRSQRDLNNRVTGTYIAPTYPYNVAGNLYDQNGFYNGQIQNNFPFAFQPTNFPQYASDVLHGYASDEWLNEDGGRPLPLEVSFATVLSVTQAQRVAKIMLLRNRQQGSGTFQMSLGAFAMQPTDVMQFTFAQNGWTEKSLEVTGINFSAETQGNDEVPSIRCSVNVIETDQSVYEWNLAEELTVYDVPALPTQTSYDPAPPTNMSLTSGASTALIGADGTVQPRIEVQWDTPFDVLTKQIQIQYQAVGAATWLSAPSVDVSLNLGFISGVIAGQQYDVRIRSARANGAISAWEEIDGYTVSVTLSTTGILSLAPGSLVGEAFSDGTAEIIVSPFTAIVGQLNVAVLPAGAVTLLGLSQSTLYWVYYIDPTFVGGAITPIATTNSADFLDKVGYFLIDSIITPSAASGGGGGGTRYLPSSYSDVGTRTTTNPSAAYDGNVLSDAVVSASFIFVGDRFTDGYCIWRGFPSVVTTVVTTLNVTATINSTGLECTLKTAYTGGSATLFDVTTSVAETTYTASIPAGTDLSTVTVSALVIGASAGSVNAAATIEGFEIWIE